MGKTIQLKKGYDINIIGAPEKKVMPVPSRTFAIKPPDFLGLSPIPKCVVKVGDTVKAGDALFFDKKQADIHYVSPVSGELIEIRRGAKRSIVEMVVLADSKIKFKNFERVDPAAAARDEVIAHMLATGCWAFLRQRPYNIAAEPHETPKAIFISGIDTSPLGIDYNFAMQGLAQPFQKGIDVLNKLVGNGKVHLSINGNETPCDTFGKVQNVELHKVSGAHPAGCVGVQIHHIDPIAKGDLVWTVNPQDVVAIGRVFDEGRFDTERMFALGGPVATKPQYFKSYLGANVENMLHGNVAEENARVISGGVLNGSSIGNKGHIGFFDHTVSILEEGDKYEPFGWLVPNYPRPSVSRTFLSFLSKKAFNVNTNTHGEPRAFVATGVYEKVLPMDIYPMQLIKSIMYKDFDSMEGLGIYEVVEEDLAICEFVCPSKTRFQEILRDGLDYMREQA